MKYQFCHGCESLVPSKAPVCPHCHSYKFDTKGPLLDVALKRLREQIRNKKNEASGEKDSE